jgi:hypothetical protein
MQNAQISNFIKIIPVGEEQFHADGQTNHQADMKKRIVAFHNFAKASKSDMCQSRPHNVAILVVVQAEGSDYVIVSDQVCNTPERICTLRVTTKCARVRIVRK